METSVHKNAHIQLNSSSEKLLDQSFNEKAVDFNSEYEGNNSNDLNKKNSNDENEYNPHEANLQVNTKNKSTPSSFLNDNDNNTKASSKKDINHFICPKDVVKIIENIHNKEELIRLFESYVPKSKNIDTKNLNDSQYTKIKRYKDCVYFGEFINGKRHGKGVMIYHNGRLYEGDWENDAKHGKGYELGPNGNIYEGGFINGKPDGYGIYTWRSGEIYEGEWKNGLKHGTGKWRGLKGDSYAGDWKFGKANGYGVHTWINGIFRLFPTLFLKKKQCKGDHYEGEFKNYLKHSQGKEKFANGDSYIGDYINGKPDGYGEYYWANGCHYKGNFKNGLRHGKGIWKKGPGQSEKYDGEWINDKKSGFGIYTWATGNYYKGNYFDDMRHGYGEMYWIDGSVYKGNWENGLQNGEGELTICGKRIHRGLFRNNVFIGKGDGSEANQMMNQQLQGMNQQLQSMNQQLQGMSQRLSRNNNNNKSGYDLNQDNNHRDESFHKLQEATSTSNTTVQNPFDNSSQAPLKTSYTHHSTSPKIPSALDITMQNDLQYEGEGSRSHLNHLRTKNFSYLSTYRPKSSKKELSTESSNRSISDNNIVKFPQIIGNRSFNQKLFSHINTKLSPQRDRDRDTNHYQGLNNNNEQTGRRISVKSTSPNQNKGLILLTQQELIKWNQIKKKMNIDPKSLENLNNPDVCMKIKAFINPPVWRPWKKHMYDLKFLP